MRKTSYNLSLELSHLNKKYVTPVDRGEFEFFHLYFWGSASEIITIDTPENQTKALQANAAINEVEEAAKKAASTVAGAVKQI